MLPFKEKIIKALGGQIVKDVSGDGNGALPNPFAILFGGSMNKISNKEAMESLRGWAYTCTKAIAEEMANMEFKLYKTRDNGEPVEIKEHALLDLLEAPNAFQTGYEFRYLMASQLEACGNCFIYLGEVKDNKQTPTTLQILSPSTVEIIKGKFPELISGYKYQSGTDSRKFETFQILHIKYPDPNDMYLGIGTIQAINEWIKTEDYQSLYNLMFFKNGASIGGFLESENATTSDQLKYLQSSFEQATAGVKKAHKVVALPKGTKFTSGGQSQKDMDFNVGLDKTRDKIMAGFRVPKTVLGITDDVNRANAEATNYVFALRTMKPKFQCITASLQSGLVSRFSEENIWIDFTNPVPEDAAQKIDEMSKAVSNQPVMSVNEARARYFGLGPIEGGDEVMGNFNMVAVGAPRAVETSKTAPSKRVKSFISRNKESAKKVVSELKDSVSKAVVDVLKQDRKKKIKMMKHIGNMDRQEFEDTVYKGFALRVSGYQKKQVAIIKDFNKKQREEVLSNLDKVFKDVKAASINDLFDEEQDVKALIDLSEPNFTDLYENEGKAAAALLGFDNINILTSEAKESINHALSLLSSSYNATTKELLRVKLEQAISEGLGLDQVKNMVGEIFDYSDDVRAEMVAHTEIFRIANDSTKQAWKETGVVKTIKWYTAGADLACEFCAPLDGKIIDIQDNFFNKGDVVTDANGNELSLDYDNVGAPPLHVNCRCYQRPEDISID